MTALAPVLARIDADLDAALDRLFALLRIPSISTDPAHEADVRRAADWLVDDLRGIGVAAERHDTTGHPMVFGTAGQTGPRLLFYGHYDVQPADPLELWARDPFDPAIEDTPQGRVIRARGASDDKGQLMTFVEACRAWIAVHGALPARVTFLFEGEEESGSPSLVPYLRAHRDALATDIALICDTGLFEDRVPAIVTRLRGLLGEEVTIHAADRDLHSGLYGGAARNPNEVLAKVLAGLRDEAGRIAVPGFYDGVTDPDADTLAAWRDLGFDAGAFLGAVGLSQPAGEADRSVLEALWSRPTAEINGMQGGYTGAGFKTVLPGRASAKVSFRLVPGQDPLAIRAAFRDWVRGQLPPDCTAEFADHGASPAAEMATGRPEFAAARAALADEWGGSAAFAGVGGSIPIAGYFRDILGLDALLAGFGKDDDRIHSPNEKYDVESFHKGIRSWARILAALA